MHHGVFDERGDSDVEEGSTPLEDDTGGGSSGNSKHGPHNRVAGVHGELPHPRCCSQICSHLVYLHNDDPGCEPQSPRKCRYCRELGSGGRVWGVNACTDITSLKCNYNTGWQKCNYK